MVVFRKEKGVKRKTLNKSFERKANKDEEKEKSRLNKQGVTIEIKKMKQMFTIHTINFIIIRFFVSLYDAFLYQKSLSNAFLYQKSLSN